MRAWLGNSERARRLDVYEEMSRSGRSCTEQTKGERVEETLERFGSWKGIEASLLIVRKGSFDATLVQVDSL